MIIAIPMFRERVSPNFSTAPEVLVVQSDGHTVWSRLRIGVSRDSLTERKWRLLALGVDTVICGGMDRATQEWFERRNVHLITNIVGDVQEVLSHVIGLRNQPAEPTRETT